MNTDLEPQSYLSRLFHDMWILILEITEQATVTFIALFLVFIVAGKISRRIKRFRNRYLGENWALIFALLNLITGGLRCMYLWDGTGTLMPSWESWLW